MGKISPPTQLVVADVIMNSNIVRMYLTLHTEVLQYHLIAIQTCLDRYIWFIITIIEYRSLGEMVGPSQGTAHGTLFDACLKHQVNILDHKA